MDRRSLLTGGLAFGVSAMLPAQAVTTSPLASASVERLGVQRVRLRWKGLSGVVRVLASSDVEAPPDLMRILSARARTGVLEADIEASPRPYFLIESASGEALRTAERLLPLGGVLNFRDIGGYTALGGARIRWGRLYRSGVMSGLTQDGLAYLSHLGVRTICDLRSQDERRLAPLPPLASQGADVVAFDYGMDKTMSSMGALFAAKTREEAVNAFVGSYLQMAEFLALHYREMLSRLLNREAPLVMNCSAGKDRTGLGSALLLSLLGVERETIIADYALSETFVPVDRYLADMRAPGTTGVIPASQAGLFLKMPEPVIRVMMGSDAEVMRRTLAEIDLRFGGPVELARAYYGLTEEGLKELRHIYLA